MSQRLSLSISYNLSLGLIPAIFAMFLGELIAKDYAIYIGTLTGVIYSLSNYYRNPSLLPNLILYFVTVVLLAFSGISLLKLTEWPGNSMAFTLELAILLPLIVAYFNKQWLANFIGSRVKPTTKRHYVQAFETGIVTVRVLMILSFLQFAILTLMVVFGGALSESVAWIMQVLVPILIFTLNTILNQLSIRFFNSILSTTELIPLVNDKGDVTGKIIKEEISKRGDEIMVPIVRIAVEYKGMLFLSRNNRLDMEERDKTDTPLESYISFGDSIQATVDRMLLWAFPLKDDLDPRFSIKYKYTGKDELKLVYLFILNMDDDSDFNDKRFVGGKLWTMGQIEANLGKGYFSEYFEEEFDHLKDVIEIREKYKDV